MLATLADYNTHIVTTDFTTGQINWALSAVSKRIQNYCNRTFEETTYRHWEHSGDRYFYAKDYPITSLYRAESGRTQVASISRPGASYSSYSIGNGNLVVNWAVGNTHTIVLSDMANIAAIATNLTTTGFTAAMIEEEDPQSLCPVSQYTLGVAYLYGPGTPLSTELDDIDRGLIYVPNLSSDWVYCEYLAGYASGDIPDDLKLVTIEWAHSALSNGTLNQNIKKLKVGTVAYEVGELQSTFLPKLDNYRKINI